MARAVIQLDNGMVDGSAHSASDRDPRGRPISLIRATLKSMSSGPPGGGSLQTFGCMTDVKGVVALERGEDQKANWQAPLHTGVKTLPILR